MAKSGLGLGRGLGSLFDTDKPELITDIPADVSPKDITTLKLSDIEPNREQPRRKFDEEKLEELAISIDKLGVIQPVVVVRNGDMYKLVAGERRWRAAKKAGLKEIPALVRNYTDEEIAQISLIENLQRENLNPIEEAAGYQALMTRFNMTQEEISETIGKSRSAVANAVRLLTLEDEIQQKLISGEISSGHARAILSVNGKELRIELLNAIIEKSLNVRQAETLAKELQKESPKPQRQPISEQLKAEIEAIENNLTSHLGTKVRLVHGDKKGKIEIEYFGNDDLERILNLIG